MTHSEYIRISENSDTAVLFIHGICGTPNHFTDYVNLTPDSISVYNILLEGHGGTVSDFANASMEKWKNQVEKTVDELSDKYINIIITAHSMGTLFAVRESIRNPEKVKALFLLAPPLKIFVKPRSAVNTMKMIFNLYSDDDEFAVCARDMHGVRPSKKLWLYLRWLPRYIELFKESASVRNIVKDIPVPCYVFHSANDELVSAKSCGYFKPNKKVNQYFLENSAHYYYDSKDKEFLLKRYKDIVSKYERGTVI